jgi:S1-C subfamily serine protease
VVLTQDGYIVTNAHVVAGAEQVQVVLSDNRVLQASLVGFDADEDLAVLKVEADGLTPAEFGDSSLLRCGDPVAAIGDPLGYRSTITDGIVSAVDREVKVEGVTMVLIQTSAAINFGNSGGALINQYGQVVGITTVKIVTDDGSAEGLGFAIPSQRVKYVVDALIDGRQIQPGVFGFTVLTHPVDGGGLQLESVHPSSDAYQKGLRAGDVITAVNGQPITAVQDLARLKLSLGSGDRVALTYLRDGASYTVEVALVDESLIT